MSDRDLCYSELMEVSRRVQKKELSPVDVTKAVLDRIAAVDKSLHSYALVLNDLALQQAKTAEQEIVKGNIKGPLHGVPIAVKDNCFTKGIVTTNGMAIRRDVKPDYDATVVAKLRDAGAILLGKIHHTEGAFAEHHPTLPVPINPWNAEALVRRVVERLRRRDRRRPLFCVTGHRYRRLDPVSLRRQWRHRAQADLWAGVALRCIRQLADARPCRADGPQRRRPRGDAGRHGRTRRKRSDHRIPRCAGLPRHHGKRRAGAAHRHRSRLRDRGRRSRHRGAARCGACRHARPRRRSQSRCRCPAQIRSSRTGCPTPP